VVDVRLEAAITTITRLPSNHILNNNGKIDNNKNDRKTRISVRTRIEVRIEKKKQESVRVVAAAECTRAKDLARRRKGERIGGKE